MAAQIDWTAVNHALTNADSGETYYHDSISGRWFTRDAATGNIEYIGDTGITVDAPDGPLWTHLDYQYCGEPIYWGTGGHWTADATQDRKEKNMIDRQTFLDALADEGKPLTSEERDIVRDAKQDKLELLFARLLARVFESADLAVLKEKPKEVLIKEA